MKVLFNFRDSNTSRDSKLETMNKIIIVMVRKDYEIEKYNTRI